MNDKHKSFITSQNKASDIISYKSEMVKMLQLLGIPLGFGDMSIGQLCEHNNISEHLFLTLANMLLFSEYEPDIDRLNSDDALQIIHFLESSHESYKRVILPRLHSNVHKIAEICSDETKTLVNRFFDEYDAEMNRHIENEEKNEFHYIKQLLKGQSSKGGSIKKANAQHDDAEIKIDDFKNIILKYVPEDCNIPQRYEAVIQMSHIASDLHFHTRIEECLLYPLAIKIEAEQKKP